MIAAPHPVCWRIVEKGYGRWSPELPAAHRDPYESSGSFENIGFPISRISDHNRPAGFAGKISEPLGNLFEDRASKRAIHVDEEVACR